jgi:hypothetical protein
MMEKKGQNSLLAGLMGYLAKLIIEKTLLKTLATYLAS